MPQPRYTTQYNLIGELMATYFADSSVVPPALTAQGYSPGMSAQIGMAVGLTSTGANTPTCGLGVAGQRPLGKLMVVHPDGTCTVCRRGYVYLPAAVGADAPVVDQDVVLDGTGKVMRAPAAAGTNQTWTLTMTGTATAGTFTLTLAGQTTAPIAYNATGAQVATALAALPGVGTGNMTGSGSALGPLTLTEAGELAGLPLPNMSVDNTFMTGGTYASAIGTPGVAAISARTGARCEQVGITDPFPAQGGTGANAALIYLS